MSRTAQISKEKRQSIITLRHEGQSIWKMSKTLKVSSSAVEETIKRFDELALMRTAIEKEDPELPLLQRISSLELTA
jgi:transposase-like protein